MEWSSYQTAVFVEASRHTQDDCAVIARAGSGKTTALVEALNHIPYRRVLLCAFNKLIQTEMERRVPAGVTCRTLHALGLRIHHMNAAHHGSSQRVQVDPDKARGMSIEMLKQNPSLYRAGSGVGEDDFKLLLETAANIRKVAAYAKNVMARDHASLTAIAGKLCDLPDRPANDRIASAALDLMERSANDPYRVDFDDMVFFPWRFGYGEEPDTEMLRFDAVLVDEQQDLNAAQHWLVDKMRRNGRILGVLDPRQTLYAFRGADREAVDQFINADGTKRLALPISYRCPTSVIEKARLVVPDIEPAPHAQDGSVTLHEYEELLNEADVGDFVLSRTNAPLMATCIRLLRRDRPAVVAGRDIGQSLIHLVEKSKTHDMQKLTTWLYGWKEKEQTRHMPEHPDRYEQASDKVACLLAVMAYSSTVAELKHKLNSMFSDASPTNQVVCSTVHKAKGLERDRVWVLSDTFGFPEPKPWQDRWSEENVWYVAVTRAKSELRFVETPIDDILRRSAQTRPLRRRKRQVNWR